MYTIDTGICYWQQDDGRIELKDTARFTKLIVAEGTTEIPFATFLDCTKVEEVVLPKSVKIIGESAFKGCSSLRKINLENIEEIKAGGFVHTKIENLVLDGIVVGSFAFSRCYALKNVIIKGYNSRQGFIIPEHCFYGNAFESISIENTNNTIIKSRAFVYCDRLKEIKGSNKITFVESEAFKQCNNLMDIELRNAIGIETNAFSGCKHLRNLVLGPKTVVTHKILGDNDYSIPSGPINITASLSSKNTLLKDYDKKIKLNFNIIAQVFED